MDLIKDSGHDQGVEINDQTKPLWNKLSGEELARQCRDFMRTYGKTLYASSMFEYLSPIYHAVNTAPWLNVAEFAQDDGAKLMARAILDWMMVDYALNYHQGMLLAASNGDLLAVATFDRETKTGSRVK